MASTFPNPYFDDVLSSETPKENNLSSTEEDAEWGAPPVIARETSIASQAAFKTLAFRRKPMRTDMAIWNVGLPVETQEYFAACSEWKSNAADVTLYSGADATGPILGVAHFRYSRHVKFGIGDPKNNPNTVVWEEMRNVSKWLTKSKFEFQIDESGDGDVNAPPFSQRRHFKWERTVGAADGVKGMAGKLSLRSYRLTDQETAQVMAVFLANNLNTIRKKGELRIFQRLSSSIETAVILTCASLSEKLARD